MSDVITPTGITPDEGKYYKSTLATDYVETVVKVGSQDKFVPNINASKWDDEAWLNINMPDVVGNEKETFDNEKIELTLGNNTHRYYELNDGRFEYEIEFAARPPTDTVTFNLDFPKGVVFYYQDTLENDWIADGHGMTLEYYLAHHRRSEDVIGSYVVKWSKRDNKYQTGKFAHIFRPKLIAADRQETWAEIHIDPATKVMTITMDKEWLDKAVYPVILDPVLGFDTDGASEYNSTTEKYGGIYQADGTGGNVVSYHFYMDTVDGSNPSVKFGLYEAPSSGNDMSGEDLVEQIEVATASTSGTNETASPGTPAITASGYYCVVTMVESSDSYLKYDTTTVRGALETGTTYGAEMVDPGGGNWTGSYTAEDDSRWIVYNPSAGGTTYADSIADGMDFGDTPSAKMTFAPSALDGVDFGDAPSSIATLIASLADGVDFGDLASIITAIAAAAADGIDLGDLPSVTKTIPGTVADGLDLGDGPGNTAQLLASVADGADFGEAISAVMTVLASVADGVDFGDVATADLAGALTGTVVDGITFTDTPSSLATLLASIADGATFGDLPSTAGFIAAAVADGITLSESAGSVLALLASAIDGITLSDTGSVIATFNVTTSDGVDFGSTIAILAQLLAQASDGIQVSDVATEVSVLPSGRVTVTLTGKQSSISFTVSAPGITFTGSQPDVDIS